MQVINQFFILSVVAIFFVGCSPASVGYVETKNPEDSKQEIDSSNSCSVSRISDTEVRISCPDGTEQVLRDGQNGTDGTNGADGINGLDGGQIEVIDPCGAQSAIGFDEVLLRLPNKAIVVYLQYNGSEYLAQLKKGIEYSTTDGTQCRFTIDDQGQVNDSEGNVF